MLLVGERGEMECEVFMVLDPPRPDETALDIRRFQDPPRPPLPCVLYRFLLWNTTLGLRMRREWGFCVTIGNLQPPCNPTFVGGSNHWCNKVGGGFSSLFNGVLGCALGGVGWGCVGVGMGTWYESHRGGGYSGVGRVMKGRGRERGGYLRGWRDVIRSGLWVLGEVL